METSGDETSPTRLLRQRAFLLQQLADAPEDGLSKRDANQKIPAAIERDLGLTAKEANLIREGLAGEGFILCRREKGKTFFVLSEQGRTYFQTLEPVPTPASRSRGQITPPSNDEVKRLRKAHLLFQLFRAEKHTLSRGQANRLSGTVKSDLELNNATIEHLYRGLEADGSVTILKERRTEKYTLAPAGLVHLGALGLLPNTRVTLTGVVLNQLMEAARMAAKQFEPAGTTASPTKHPATPGELADAVLEEFAELRREKYHLAGMVPIHEIRQRIRARFGEASARHDVLDEVIRGLWRDGRMKLVTLSDLGRATPEQLQDSVPGVGETLFYLEAAHEPAVL
jgi:hypothetical protein